MTKAQDQARLRLRLQYAGIPIDPEKLAKAKTVIDGPEDTKSDQLNH